MKLQGRQNNTIFDWSSTDIGTTTIVNSKTKTMQSNFNKPIEFIIYLRDRDDYFMNEKYY